MKFSEHLWNKITPIYEQIITLPFNTELANGTLSFERFIFYMQQDSRYLMGFSRALALIAGRNYSSKLIEKFLNFSEGALIAERELHKKFLDSLDSEIVEPSPSCMAYTQFLMATASIASLEEATAAVLPCFWIYREVGRHIANNSNSSNRYIEWIKTYSSQEFSDGTDQAIAVLDELAAFSTPCILKKMEKAFEYSSLYEWHFWNEAHQMTIFSAQDFQDCSKRELLSTP